MRCHHPDCKKKLSLSHSTMKCQCNHCFCDKHRFFTDHNCEHILNDKYKQNERLKLKLDNPKISGDKFVKL